MNTVFENHRKSLIIQFKKSKQKSKQKKNKEIKKSKINAKIEMRHFG